MLITRPKSRYVAQHIFQEVRCTLTPSSPLLLAPPVAVRGVLVGGRRQVQPGQEDDARMCTMTLQIPGVVPGRQVPGIRLHVGEVWVQQADLLGEPRRQPHGQRILQV